MPAPRPLIPPGWHVYRVAPQRGPLAREDLFLAARRHPDSKTHFVLMEDGGNSMLTLCGRRGWMSDNFAESLDYPDEKACARCASIAREHRAELVA